MSVLIGGKNINFGFFFYFFKKKKKKTKIKLMIEEMEEVDGRTNQTIFMIIGNFLLFVHVCFDILMQGIAVYI